mgnify:CR=1 FL=1
MTTTFDRLRGGLIVSCQALPDEPLHSSFIMSRMALAAERGGAVGIRANSVADILAIRETVKLPMIGIIKTVFKDSPVYITPTQAQVSALVKTGVEIIAMDATDRIRPDGHTLKTLFPRLRSAYPQQLFMADCSSFADAAEAEKLGFDCVGTTLAGYTEATCGRPIPDFTLLHQLCQKLSVPVIAEGGIHTPEELRQAIDIGAWCAVVGGAITRPMEITQRFVAALGGNRCPS